MFTYGASGRAQMIPEPLSHSMEDGWTVDKGWKLTGWNPSPQWQGAEHKAGIMFENEDGTERAWFHWQEYHLDQLPTP